MFPFDADCAYCRELNPNKERNGKFYCEKTKTYVPANTSVFSCNYRAEAMGRSQTEKNRLSRISKDHGYYVVTAISQILGLPEDNEYMCAFMYLRDTILPAREEYKDFIDDYGVDGPALARLLEDDENAQDYAEYLRVSYLNGLVSLFCQDRVSDAMALYTSMLDAIKERYGYQRSKEKEDTVAYTKHN